MIFPSQHLTETVQVQTYGGEGAYGPSYAVAVTTKCNLDAGRRLVRSQAGDEVVSESTLRLSPDLDPALDIEALFTPESLVAVRNRQSRVITAKPMLVRGRLVYLEVTLT